MTRTLRYALTAVLSVAVVIPAIAQDNFPDVPDNHWAYEALKRMKSEGLLVGYPDGLFRGARPATRYELAVAVHATYVHLRNMIDNLNTQIAAIQDQLKGKADQADLQNLRSALEALQNTVNTQGQDIADLKKMADTFEKELASLGVDVQQMKKDLGDLGDRMTALENRLPVDISGELNFVLLSGYGTDDLNGLTVDGRPTGVGRDAYNGQLVGGNRDLTILHEAALTLTSARKTGPKFKLTTVVGNMLNDGSNWGCLGFGEQSNGVEAAYQYSGAPFGEAPEDMYIQTASVAFDTSVYGLGFGVEAGRVGYKVAPYIFQRPDTTPYYANDRWDNGDWNFDGAILGFSFGTAKLNLFGGRTPNYEANYYDFTPALASGGTTAPGTSVGGSYVQPLSAGRTPNWVIGDYTDTYFGRPVGVISGDLGIDQFMGLNLNLPFFNKGSLNLAYMWLDSNNPIPVGEDVANRVTVMGADSHFSFGNFLVNAGYSQTDLMYNDTKRSDEDNAAWYGNIGLESGKWGAQVGYRSIDPLFAAPGDWGRLGLWNNPVDIEGMHGSAHYDLSNDIRLQAAAESYRGRGTANSFLTNDDKITHYTLGVDYKMASNYDLAFGVEETRWNLQDTLGFNNNAIERWYNIGFGWSLSDNAKMKFLWQISDYKALNNEFFSGENRGGLITTQLSVKF